MCLEWPRSQQTDRFYSECCMFLKIKNSPKCSKSGSREKALMLKPMDFEEKNRHARDRLVPPVLVLMNVNGDDSNRSAGFRGITQLRGLTIIDGCSI